MSLLCRTGVPVTRIPPLLPPLRSASSRPVQEGDLGGRGVNAAPQNFHPSPWFEHPVLPCLRPLTSPTPGTIVDFWSYSHTAGGNLLFTPHSCSQLSHLLCPQSSVEVEDGIIAGPGASSCKRNWGQESSPHTSPVYVGRGPASGAQTSRAELQDPEQLQKKTPQRFPDPQRSPDPRLLSPPSPLLSGLEEVA